MFHPPALHNFQSRASPLKPHNGASLRLLPSLFVPAVTAPRVSVSIVGMIPAAPLATPTMSNPASFSLPALSTFSPTCAPVVYEQRNVMSLSFIVNPDGNEHKGDDQDNTYNSDCSSDSEHSSMASPTDTTLTGTLCSKKNCYRPVNNLFGPFCEHHKPSRFCKVAECGKCAKTGGYCISHGGGRRCHTDGCMKSAKEGGYCIAHGGGKRCKEEGCTKSALAGGLCSAHGGGKRCKAAECTKTALKGGLCIAHGGGRRCEVDGCSKSAVGGHLCVSHGGGRRCREADCNKGAVRHGLCIRHGARKTVESK